MTVSEAILNRSTIRAYLQTEVPRDLIEEILSIARFAPSICNCQPWHIAVVSGKARQDLEREMIEGYTSGTLKINPKFPDGSQGLHGA